MTRTAAYATRTWHDIHYRHSTPARNVGGWEQFQYAEDPFNPGDTSTGYVQRAGGNEYRSLVITHVNDRGRRSGIGYAQSDLSLPTRYRPGCRL